MRGWLLWQLLRDTPVPGGLQRDERVLQESGRMLVQAGMAPTGLQRMPDLSGLRQRVLHQSVGVHLQPGLERNAVR